MTDPLPAYRFMVCWPPVAGTSLGPRLQALSVVGERQADAYRRLRVMIDDTIRTTGQLPDVQPWHGPAMPPSPVET